MKQVKVKQSVRKGKLVRGYNRVLKGVTNTLIKRDNKGKKKLTNLSKGLITAGSIAGLLTAFKYRRNIGQLSEKIVNKVSPTVGKTLGKTGKTVSKPITNTSGNVMAASVTGGALTRDGRRKYIKDIVKELDSDSSITIQPTNNELTLSARKRQRNGTLLNKRVTNARGKLTSGNYNPDNDLYLAIKTNKDFSFKGGDNAAKRATRKQLAKQLQRQLGVVNRR